MQLLALLSVQAAGRPLPSYAGVTAKGERGTNGEHHKAMVSGVERVEVIRILYRTMLVWR